MISCDNDNYELHERIVLQCKKKPRVLFRDCFLCVRFSYEKNICDRSYPSTQPRARQAGPLVLSELCESKGRDERPNTRAFHYMGPLDINWSLIIFLRFSLTSWAFSLFTALCSFLLIEQLSYFMGSLKQFIGCFLKLFSISCMFCQGSFCFFKSCLRSLSTSSCGSFSLFSFKVFSIS